MTADDVQFAIEWVSSLATPTRPEPSAWTDVEWCEHWRAQRSRVTKTLSAALDALVRAQPPEPKHGDAILNGDWVVPKPSRVRLCRWILHFWTFSSGSSAN